MKKKVMVGLVSVVVAVALVFGGVTFYNNRQQEKFEKQMASYESVDTMQHPSEATTSIDGIQVPLGKKPKVTTKKHYQGTELEIRLKRKYSFSDRCRYYMPTPAVEAAADRLLTNLRTLGIPLNLLSQFMPIQYTKVREGYLKNDPVELIEDRIINTIDEYLYGTHQNELL